MRTSLIVLCIAIGFALGWAISPNECTDQLKEVESTYVELIDAYKQKLEETLPHK